jgi:leader peptidase (prepilin peptidase)/N-methyltransferase
LANLAYLLITNQTLTLFLVAGLSLCVGSFLNVVIHRTPLIMQQGWRQECTIFLHPEQPPLNEPLLTLSLPASRCPSCNHQIRWYENIPLISWIALRGQCSCCHHPIGVRYPLVELGTMLASIVVFIVFGPTLTMLAALGMTWMLIALTGIDFDTQLLPDHMTLPLIAAGLLVNTQTLFVTPTQAIVGAVVGFLVLWVINAIAKAVMKRDGIGGGDFKLLAALGAWLGPLMLPLILLMSSLIGSVIGLILLCVYKESRPFAFGPYLAIAGWIAMLWGTKIVSSYLVFAYLS